MPDNQLFWRALLWMRSLVLLTVLISLNPIISGGSPVEGGQLPQSPQLERNIVVHQKLEGADRRIELRYNRVSSIWSGIGKLTVFAEDVNVVVDGAFDREGLKLRVRAPNFRIGSWASRSFESLSTYSLMVRPRCLYMFSQPRVHRFNTRFCGLVCPSPNRCLSISTVYFRSNPRSISDQVTGRPLPVPVSDYDTDCRV